MTREGGVRADPQKTDPISNPQPQPAAPLSWRSPGPSRAAGTWWASPGFPGTPALYVLMAAKRDEKGNIVEQHKETPYIVCGRCLNRERVTTTIHQCSKCELKYEYNSDEKLFRAECRKARGVVSAPGNWVGRNGRKKMTTRL